MSGFDYPNARLRAMKSRLLKPEELAVLAGEASVDTLLNALTRTPYRDSVEMALVQESGMVALSRALQHDMNGRFQKIRRSFSGKTADLLHLVLLRYDIDNLKAVLRGLSQQLPAEEILAATIAWGTLAAADLSELAQAANTREALDLLATWRLPLAHPLLTLRAESPGAALWQLENALEQWYFEQGQAQSWKGGQAFQDSLKNQADIANIMTVLRLVGSAGQAILYGRQFAASDPLPLLIGPGSISFSLLVEAARAETLEAAVERLSRTKYGRSLNSALERYHHSKRLSSFEKALQRQQLRQAKAFLVKDPHGIGVLLGYLELSGNESANLRRIGQGLYLRRPSADIQADLLFSE